ncbi:DEDD protein, partial [Atractosteus spatula]|nr:DEDD protein [Atractosteus spatula]
PAADEPEPRAGPRLLEAWRRLQPRGSPAPLAARHRPKCGVELLLELERRGYCSESRLGPLLELLRVLTRHDLLPFVSRKKRRTGQNGKLFLRESADVRLAARKEASRAGQRFSRQWRPAGCPPPLAPSRARVSPVQPGESQTALSVSVTARKGLRTGCPPCWGPECSGAGARNDPRKLLPRGISEIAPKFLKKNKKKRLCSKWPRVFARGCAQVLLNSPPTWAQTVLELCALMCVCACLRRPTVCQCVCVFFTIVMFEDAAVQLRSTAQTSPGEFPQACCVRARGEPGAGRCRRPTCCAFGSCLCSAAGSREMGELESGTAEDIRLRVRAEYCEHDAALRSSVSSDKRQPLERQFELFGRASTVLRSRDLGSILCDIKFSELAYLDAFWADYLSGALLEALKGVFITDSLKRAVGQEAVRLLVSVDQDDYEEGRRLLLEAQSGPCCSLAPDAPRARQTRSAAR